MPTTDKKAIWYADGATRAIGSNNLKKRFADGRGIRHQDHSEPVM